MAADRERKLRERVAELEADVEWTHPSYNRLLDELEAERAARVRVEEALRELLAASARWGKGVTDAELGEPLYSAVKKARAVLAAVPEKDTT